MRKLLSIILTMLVLVVFGCGNSMEKKAMEQGKLALANKEYDKASASLQLVLEENSKNNEARKIKDIIDVYLSAKKSLDSNNLDDANTTLNSIDGDYYNYAIKDDVDSLKTDIQNKISLREKAQNDIAKAESLLNEKKYDEAKTIIEGLDKNNLDETQNNKASELSSTITKELAKIKEANEAKQAQAKKTLTPQEAKQLILNEDGIFISKVLNDHTRFLPDYKEYSANDMPTGDAWAVPKEACYEFSICDYDNNGEVANDYCEYLVGKNSGNVYVMSNQGNTSVYQIKNNQKVKTFKWVAGGDSFEWHKQ